MDQLSKMLQVIKSFFYHTNLWYFHLSQSTVLRHARLLFRVKGKVDLKNNVKTKNKTKRTQVYKDELSHFKKEAISVCYTRLSFLCDKLLGWWPSTGTKKSSQDWKMPLQKLGSGSSAHTAAHDSDFQDSQCLLWSCIYRTYILSGVCTQNKINT